MALTRLTIELRILFRTSDLSQVKDYCVRQWTKIHQDRVSIQDFCFSREVKLGTYKYVLLFLLIFIFPQFYLLMKLFHQQSFGE